MEREGVGQLEEMSMGASGSSIQPQQASGLDTESKRQKDAFQPAPVQGLPAQGHLLTSLRRRCHLPHFINEETDPEGGLAQDHTAGW